MKERTFVLLKPDALQRNLMGEIIGRYETEQLSVVNGNFILPSIEQIAEHYNEHTEKPYYNRLESYLRSGKVFAMIVEGNRAVEKVRRINGSTDPKTAASGTIRGDLAESIDSNLVHASDSPQAVEREIGIWMM